MEKGETGLTPVPPTDGMHQPETTTFRKFLAPLRLVPARAIRSRCALCNR
jgi:hypothetical protein